VNALPPTTIVCAAAPPLEHSMESAIPASSGPNPRLMVRFSSIGFF
jgi:hypothetical protein